MGLNWAACNLKKGLSHLVGENGPHESDCSAKKGKVSASHLLLPVF